jgi:hypothetical protein
MRASYASGQVEDIQLEYALDASSSDACGICRQARYVS